MNIIWESSLIAKWSVIWTVIWIADNLSVICLPGKYIIGTGHLKNKWSEYWTIKSSLIRCVHCSDVCYSDLHCIWMVGVLNGHSVMPPVKMILRQKGFTLECPMMIQGLEWQISRFHFLVPCRQILLRCHCLDRRWRSPCRCLRSTTCEGRVQAQSSADLGSWNWVKL